MRIGIIARHDATALGMVRRVMRLLKGQEIILEPGLAKALKKRPGTLPDLRNADAVITVGGDGTVLLAQQLAPNVTIFGINLGGRGFLADIEPNEVQTYLNVLLGRGFKHIERQMLAGSANGKQLPHALNDVVVSSANPGKTVDLKVTIDGNTAMDVRCDGVILATTTGSTAYAYAAGGPAIDPRIDAILVVPICPAHPTPHPIVAPAESRVAVETTHPRRDALVVVDGIPRANIKNCGRVEVKKSGAPARFCRCAEFYRKTREKL